MSKVALILTTFNRPEELRRCLDSLAKAVQPDVLIIVDDRSDIETKVLLFDFNWIPIQHYINKSINKGIKDSLLLGFEAAFKEECDLAINLDPDAVVRPNFIPRLVELHERHEGNRIVSGFNCNHPENPITKEYNDFVCRKHANGINFCINQEQYEKIVKPGLLSAGNWDFDSTHQHDFIITKPSVVQHIAPHNSLMGHANGDVACDFKLLSLPNVTLFGIDSHDPQGIMKASETSQRDIDFGSVTIITDDLFTKGGDKETRRADYSRFMVQELTKYVNTDHVLTIHSDGYILNSAAWDDSWMNWDYIGALWHWKPKHRNGNGGFSLRSKKFIEATADLSSRGIIKNYHPEDERICDTYRPILEREYGIKYAPDQVCNKFSIEAFGNPDPRYTDQFGFHGGDIDFSALPDGDRPYYKRPRKMHYPALVAWNQRKPTGRRR